jgi:hypothetical protein
LECEWPAIETHRILRRTIAFAFESGYNTAMKALLILSLALLGAGCTTSKYANDPRAFLVGPDYLDYIDNNPRDRDTQYYYPVLKVDGYAATNLPQPKASAPATVAALMTVVPEPSECVKKDTGKGWPKLERTGLSVSAKPRY